MKNNIIVQSARRLKNRIVLRKNRKPQDSLEHFILGIVDHCNLKCVCCDHFASIARPRNVELVDIFHDLKRMSELVSGSIKVVSIMGGEPLLHPQLTDIVRETRRQFPNSYIHIDTNGLLLKKQDDDFWKAVVDCGAEIIVTKYPINMDYEELEKFACEKGAVFRLFIPGDGYRTSMIKMPLDITGSCNFIKSFNNCYHKNMHFLREGKLYPCTIMPNIHIFNDAFNQNIETVSGDWIDIDLIEDEKEILDFLCAPKKFCRYCRTKDRVQKIPWRRTHKTIDEWT